MEVSIDTILLTLIIGCLVMIIAKNKSVPSPESPKKAKLSQRQGKIKSQYNSHDVFRIVITGGPCAGKTTGINKLASELSNSIKVLVVPEASTLLVKGGAINNFVGLDNNAQVEFQASLMQLQMALEDAFTEIASSFNEKSLVICDRGVMDGSAYISSDLWQALLDERGWTAVHLRDRRYEAVVHLVSAANGAEKYYSLCNNVARYEGIKEAQIVDSNLQKAWVGHSHLTIIDNESTKSFEHKINNLLNHVLWYIGASASLVNTRKYLLKHPQSIPNVDEVQVVKIYIEDIFLKGKSSEISKIQRRGQSGSFFYTHSTKKKLDDDEYSVNKCQITAREYIVLGNNKDVSRKTVKRLRQCFIYKNQYFMLNTYLNVKGGISILRVENLKDMESVEIPLGLSILRDVTEDPGYSTYIISKINWYVSSKDKDIIFDQ
ncbi:hypothetical protein SteCoe_26793 [Stentor coeruleus]|uniref:NadR/Ttd14 AAA domain-containing protein n=1 Tax=Stentor coeruleus TaxID=5963 RepID=A0A1R2BC07_9CILI|nr:hypothetical protein SteCoe_26793 [Stentor coeruleus]